MGNAERVGALLGASQVEFVYGERDRDRNRIEKELEELTLAGDNLMQYVKRPMAPAAEITAEEYARDRWNQAKVKLMTAILARPVKVNHYLGNTRYERYARWNGRSPEHQSEHDMSTHGTYDSPFIMWARQRVHEYEQFGGRMLAPGVLASQDDFDAYLDQRIEDRAAGKEQD